MQETRPQFEALLRDDLWLRNAAHANAMARLLAARLRDLDDVVPIAYPVEANGVFPILQREAIEPLQRERRFYMWDEQRSIVRWMTAWDTQPEDVHAFADAVWRIAPGERRVAVSVATAPPGSPAAP